MNVSNTLYALEQNSEEIPAGKRQDIRIINHPTNPELVQVQIGDGIRYTLQADELTAAIINATNTVRPGFN